MVIDEVSSVTESSATESGEDVDGFVRSTRVMVINEVSNAMESSAMESAEDVNGFVRES